MARKAGAWFAERLVDRSGFAAFVVDDPELGVVGCAAGVCDRRAPTPVNLDGVQGRAGEEVGQGPRPDGPSAQEVVDLLAVSPLPAPRVEA